MSLSATWSQREQIKVTNCSLNSIKNCHSDSLTSFQKIINLIIVPSQNLRSTVILSSPGFG